MADKGLRRGLRLLRRELLSRRRPNGLVSLRYLWPGSDRRIRLHRQFWLLGGARKPRLLWFAVEMWQWLRWLTWYAVPAGIRALRRFGGPVALEEGIPRWVQAWRVFWLALSWSIPPVDMYRYRLYRSTKPALDYVYDAENFGFHQWRSAPLGLQWRTLERLQDKAAVARELASVGVPMVPTLTRVTADEGVALVTLIDGSDRVFCKLNGGNRGQGAFSAWKTADGMAGLTLQGKALPDSVSVEQAWQGLLQRGAALVQPCLENHPQLMPLAWQDEVITVRFISQWVMADDSSRQGLTCQCATLEVPIGAGEAGRMHYIILPIDPDKGLLGLPLSAPWLDGVLQDERQRVLGLAQAIKALPCWPDLVRASYCAHERFPDLCAIAWDWVITAQGPILLEGNSGWGVSAVQILQGPFLRNRMLLLAQSQSGPMH